MINTAMFGGSFDPIHLGHLHVIHNVFKKTRYKKFILVPLFVINLKKKIVLHCYHRINMINLSLEDYKSFIQKIKIWNSYWRVWKKRKGFFYTDDTVDLHMKIMFNSKLD